jgi:hypothetical protein
MTLLPTSLRPALHSPPSSNDDTVIYLFDPVHIPSIASEFSSSHIHWMTHSRKLKCIVLSGKWREDCHLLELDGGTLGA